MEIRKASPGDYSKLEALTKREGWNYSLEDFVDLDRTGCGTTLVATLDGGIRGMITLMDYGEVGWISNMLVERSYRGRRLGAELLSEGVQQLGAKRTVALFSYEDAVRFYLREGFKLEGGYTVVRYTGGQGGISSGKGVGIDAIESMDRKVFSARRRGLLEMLVGKGQALSPASGNGFALVRPDPVEPMVGPVVCDDASAGRELLYAAFNLLEVGARAVMVSETMAGLEVVERVSRLYVGEPPQTDTGMALAFAGLEFG
jgi:predicted N-acetyltransferase YhbS